MNGHYSVVAMLLAQGADCQMRSISGLTAAQLAAQSGHFEIRDLLESHGKKLVTIPLFNFTSTECTFPGCTKRVNFTGFLLLRELNS